MKHRFGVLGLSLVLAFAVLSCSKKKEEATTTPPAQSETQTPAAMDTSMTPPDTSSAAGANVGSYSKLNMASLTPEQNEKVMKRLTAENCTCGCVGDTIDRCLRNDPACGVAVTLAMQVIDDVKAGK